MEEITDSLTKSPLEIVMEEECLQRNLFASEANYCPAYFDGIMCWDRTPPYTKAVQKCFKYFHGEQYDDTQNATRRCLNGVWENLTDYRNCTWVSSTNTTDDTVNPTPSLRGTASPLSDGVPLITSLIDTSGYSLSLAVLAIAILVLIFSKVAAPISECSDDTYKTVSVVKPSSAAPLTIAALILTLCGALTCGLSFSIMYTMGRRYYLDFGVLSGFTCFLLGLLGFRSRRHHLLPNRNYVSGYIVLSSFSLLSSVGLLVLLTLRPAAGTALCDVTSGGVCAVSALCLALCAAGALASYCGARDPPDNRVAVARWR